VSYEKQTVNILLVEDNPGDVRLTMEAFKECKKFIELYNVTDGSEVLPFLKKEGEYGDKPRPDMIFLDLNLPRKKGHDVLEEIKRDKNFRTIPVVILSTSKAEEDILKSYNLQANCFLQKPVNLDQFKKMVKSIDGFWFNFVEYVNNE
jgi:two-component system response regulator